MCSLVWLQPWSVGQNTLGVWPFRVQSAHKLYTLTRCSIIILCEPVCWVEGAVTGGSTEKHGRIWRKDSIDLSFLYKLRNYNIIHTKPQLSPSLATTCISVSAACRNTCMSWVAHDQNKAINLLFCVRVLLVLAKIIHQYGCLGYKCKRSRVDCACVSCYAENVQEMARVMTFTSTLGTFPYVCLMGKLPLWSQLATVNTVKWWMDLL